MPRAVLQSRGPNAKDPEIDLGCEDEDNNFDFEPDDSCNLRPIIIDGSNVALRYSILSGK